MFILGVVLVEFLRLFLVFCGCKFCKEIGGLVIILIKCLLGKYKVEWFFVRGIWNRVEFLFFWCLDNNVLVKSCSKGVLDLR